MTISDLPTEILLEIISNLSSDKGALCNIALACKAFTSPCQSYIFQDITLKARNLLDFDALLRRAPRFIPFVRKCHILDLSGQGAGGRQVDVLVRVMHCLTSLHTAVLTRFFIMDGDKTSLQVFRHSLTALQLDKVYFRNLPQFCGVLASLTCLKTLRCKQVHFSDLSLSMSYDTAPTLRLPPTLQSLYISQTALVPALTASVRANPQFVHLRTFGTTLLSADLPHKLNGLLKEIAPLIPVVNVDIRPWDWKVVHLIPVAVDTQGYLMNVVRETSHDVEFSTVVFTCPSIEVWNTLLWLYLHVVSMPAIRRIIVDFDSLVAGDLCRVQNSHWARLDDEFARRHSDGTLRNVSIRSTSHHMWPQPEPLCEENRAFLSMVPELMPHVRDTGGLDDPICAKKHKKSMNNYLVAPIWGGQKRKRSLLTIEVDKSQIPSSDLSLQNKMYAILYYQ
ncbi:hypothetical protein FISHEDRAFT_61294 [Fistulina hepatica ATCC 64428]|uniref:F-box domain-containing protein n=1 Tax=Fistulina hepatica ATCC 64428 TaxID=1128425 RepID=A0A0D7A3C2_9AGAR|nr:hypothetical protein FISHEDRAFT_61294 [Fistulina hepatica ATCC 64428]